MKVKELLFVITLKDIRMKSLKKTNERLVIVTENILRMIALLIIVLLEEVMREGLRDEQVEVFQLLIFLFIILLIILLLLPMIISKLLSTIDANQVA